MARFPTRYTFNKALAEIKSITMRRINNYNDKKIRVSLLEVVMEHFCSDNIHLLSDPIVAYSATWATIRSNYDQEAITLLLNVTTDFLLWLSDTDMNVTTLQQALIKSFIAPIPTGIEAVPNLDPTNTLASQAIEEKEFTKFVQENNWYMTIMLLSSSDIRADIRISIEAIVEEQNG